MFTKKRIPKRVLKPSARFVGKSVNRGIKGPVCGAGGGFEEYWQIRRGLSAEIQERLEKVLSQHPEIWQPIVDRRPREVDDALEELGFSDLVAMRHALDELDQSWAENDI